MSYHQQQQHSSASTSALIWFKLVDPISGLPYKGAFVSSVLSSSLIVPVVDEFRDAVHLKNSKKLSSIDAADLIVYKNESTFEIRKSTDDEGTGGGVGPH